MELTKKQIERLTLIDEFKDAYNRLALYQAIELSNIYYSEWCSDYSGIIYEMYDLDILLRGKSITDIVNMVSMGKVDITHNYFWIDDKDHLYTGSEKQDLPLCEDYSDMHDYFCENLGELKMYPQFSKYIELVELSDKSE